MPNASRELVYEGSVKNLWQLGDSRLEFEYTDAYSVFDWGRMPDALTHKGEALAAMGTYFFESISRGETWKSVRSSNWLKNFSGTLKERLERELAVLEREGMKSHFVERSGPNKIVVQRVAVHRPDCHALGGQVINSYLRKGWDDSTRLIPLEVVFRFGMPKGSSLVERLTPEYARQLGLSGVPREGELFSQPVVEFFTKLEDTDRFLTWEQALNYAGLEFEQFGQVVARTLCLAVYLAEAFGSKGLELWDGKFEWALIDGKLALVDSIGPDELRLLDPKTRTQISKEFLRLYYRDTPWFEAVKQAKKEAASDPSIDWKDLVLKRVGEPPGLSPAFRAAADVLYPTLAKAVTGNDNPGGAAVSMPELLERIQKCLAR